MISVIPQKNKMGDRGAALAGETRTGETGIGAVDHRFPAGPESGARTSGAGEAESQRTHRNRKSGVSQSRTCQWGQRTPCLLGEKPSRLKRNARKVPKEKLTAAGPASPPTYSPSVGFSRPTRHRMNRGLTPCGRFFSRNNPGRGDAKPGQPFSAQPARRLKQVGNAGDMAHQSPRPAHQSPQGCLCAYFLLGHPTWN